jgi:hypothetical protein
MSNPADRQAPNEIFHGYPSLLVLVRHGESLRNALKKGRIEVPDTPEAHELSQLHDH